MTLQLLNFSERAFKLALKEAQQNHDIIKNNTTSAELLENSYTAQYFLTNDGLSGYSIDKGELKSLFSCVKGRGDLLVKSAIKQGATYLDHFRNKKLNDLYNYNGFDLVRTEKHYNYILD